MLTKKQHKKNAARPTHKSGFELVLNGHLLFASPMTATRSFLRLSDVDATKLTPAMAQYAALKKEHPKALLFFQMGDFYELFFEDAVYVTETLGLALTHRGQADGHPIPMCGVPLHASNMYLARLLKNSQHVALCEQQETPSNRQSTGPLKRGITKILTPGTATEDFLLETPLNNFLMVLSLPHKERWGVAAIDTSTGDVFVESTTDLLSCHLLTWNPCEIVIPFEHYEDTFLQPLKQLYRGRLISWPKVRFARPSSDLKAVYGALGSQRLAQLIDCERQALHVAIDYATMARGLPPSLSLPVSVTQEAWMDLDPFTRKSLDLFESNGRDKKAHLFGALNETRTPGGARLLSRRLMAPSCDLTVIQNRLAAVDFFVQNEGCLQEVRTRLQGLGDIERALQRLKGSPPSPKDLGHIRNMLLRLPPLCETLGVHLIHAGKASTQAQCAHKKLSLDPALGEHLKSTLCETLPTRFEAGQIIASGANAELDTLRQTEQQVDTELKQLEAHYQQGLGLPQLRVKSNNMIGFFIEVPRRFVGKVPSSFTLRQGMAGASRYTTPPLQDLHQRILTAADEAETYERHLFEACVQETLMHSKALLTASKTLAVLDVTTTFAHIARQRGYVKPSMTQDKTFVVKGGRHPVVETVLQGETFSANDCHFDQETTFKLLTAPNMAGKSTYLRQNALIAIMAHMGSFVPAESATLGVVDRLFCRVGAGDDLTQGHSTFMVEMMETAHILRHATPKSLVILDEVGRGTSTHDGLAIAKACVNYLVKTLQCRTLFATHYVELASLETTLPPMATYTLQVQHIEGKLAFLHRVIPGISENAYGLEVARLAGLPQAVLEEAAIYKQQLETQKTAPRQSVA